MRGLPGFRFSLGIGGPSRFTADAHRHLAGRVVRPNFVDLRGRTLSEIPREAWVTCSAGGLTHRGAMSDDIPLDPDAFRRLAAAVVVRAIRRGRVNACVRMWCDLAGVDPDRLQELQAPARRSRALSRS